MTPTMASVKKIELHAQSAARKQRLIDELDDALEKEDANLQALLARVTDNSEHPLA